MYFWAVEGERTGTQRQVFACPIITFDSECLFKLLNLIELATLSVLFVAYP